MAWETISFYVPSEDKSQLSRNFKVSEFKSRDYPTVVLSTELINKLQILRDKVGAPINVNSGFRSYEHNKSTGGSTNSAHLIGAGADIWTPKLSTMQLARLIQKTFGKEVAIGAHPDLAYVHFDVVYRGNWYVTSLANKVSTF